MKFDPKTEEEVTQGGLLPKGEYDFEVKNAEEGQSKAGNDMISLTLHVYNSEGGYHRVLDWLVSTDGGAYKVRHFAYAVGLGTQYERGELCAEDLEGVTGRCKIVIQKSKDPQYQDKNSVADYLPPASATNSATHMANGDPRPPVPPLDDEIPF